MRYTIKIHRRIRLACEVFELAFTRPAGLDFQPGQHIRFHCQGADKSYTPVSAAVGQEIRICVKRASHSGFSTRLIESAMGSPFEISGPYGYFLYHPSDGPAVFVGTGTGVAPFVAFARSGVSGYILLQGARDPAQLIYGDLLEKNSLKYVPCLSRPHQGCRPQGFEGRVTDYLKTILPEGSYRFYLCGGRQMIRDAVDIIDHRFPDSFVFTERFG